MASIFMHNVSDAVSSSIRPALAALIGLVAVTGYAWSADLPAPAAPAAPVAATAAYNWNGLYLGLNAGGTFGTDATTVSGGVNASASQNLPGFVGGAQIGVNYQTGAVVWGFEGDFDASTQNTSINSAILAGSSSQMPWLATLRGRLGVAFDRLLVYGTAGGAAGELRSNFNVAGIGSTSTTRTYGTWIAGAGLEYGITDNLTARAEYLYLDTGNVATGTVGPPATTITSRLKDNLLRAGLNYRFPVAW